MRTAIVEGLRHDSRAYVERGTYEGLSKMEIIRCPKCHLAREVFRTLCEDRWAVRGLHGLQARHRA